jgi:hypothetical protein
VLSIVVTAFETAFNFEARPQLPRLPHA